jgi:hypothetical protein
MHMGRLSNSVVAGAVATAVCAVGCSSGEDPEGSGSVGGSSGVGGSAGWGASSGTGGASGSASETGGASGAGGSTGGGAGVGGASSGTSGRATGGSMNSDPSCMASETAETECADGIDSDCDEFVDCLDTDCDGNSCGENLSCLAGACLGPGALPELPRIENLVPTVRGDTATVTFEAVLDAVDYRIYPLPSDDDVLVGADGEVVVKNAIYRCSGAQPRADRSTNEFEHLFPFSLEGTVNGYARAEAESVLGYVFLSPGPDRTPVYRVANPNLVGGYAWEYGAPPAKEYNGADYVASEAERDALLAQGYRDDGIAFYAPTEGTVTVYRREFEDNGLVTFYADGPEKDVRDGQPGTGGPRFQVLATESSGSVPLHRIFYGYHNDHDNLAAGDANKRRVLYQGQAPVLAATWPALTGPTTLVIEALDTGCPFPGGYVSAMAAPAAELGGVPGNPSLTLSDARSETTGEVFINGQFEPANRPKPIARGYVTVEPKAHPQMDWFQSFDPDSTDNLPDSFVNIVADNIGTKVFRNDHLSLEFEGTNANVTFGSMLGQFAIGSAATFAITALGANARIGGDDFLHVTMSVDLPSTSRRYPQIFITDTPLGDLEVDLPHKVPVLRRLGPLTEEDRAASPGKYHTIVAQTFGGGPEMQVEFCDLRGWGVSQQCPKANIYGFPAGSELDWTAPWLPLPVVGDYVGMDRLAKIDVYASTSRVYVFLEGRPAGCAVLPEGKMPGGPVNVLFGMAGYHIDIDEHVASEFAAQLYWNRYSLTHIDRKLDDLGIQSGVAAPAWDETIMPCGDRYYAGQLGSL